MDQDIREITLRIERASELADRILAETGKVLFGQRYMMERLLVGLFADGHVLLEGVPGLAKTLAVKTLAATMQAKFQRIQFTPDLLPADLVGTLVYNQRDGQFTTRKGPLFANFVLADEINRAPAKVQSALLEAMQERQVTIGEKTFPLDEPFLVLATQNPIEQEGTYPLPEAQLDRFMFNIMVGYPSATEEIEIMKMVTSSYVADLKVTLSAEQILSLNEIVRKVPVAEHVFEYARDLARATRPKEPEAPDYVREWVQWGAGPRASLYMILGGKARAILHGRYHVTTEDIDVVAYPVLRHRIITTFNAEAEGIKTDQVIDRLLQTVPKRGEEAVSRP
jgi:MoxR-like ATPase